MRRATFTDLIFLLHHERLPSAAERRLIDAILIGVADHGAGAPSCAAARLAASGNRQSLSAAIAAGVLTIGDEHGGAGSGCMELIAAGLERRARDGAVARRRPRAQLVDEANATRRAVARLRPSRALDDRSARGGALRARRGRRAGRATASASRARSKPRSRERIKPIPLNIDGALAAILIDLGLPVDGRRSCCSSSAASPG